MYDDLVEMPIAEIEKMILARHDLINQKMGVISSPFGLPTCPPELNKKIIDITTRLTAVQDVNSQQTREIFVEFYNLLTNYCIERKYIYIN